MADVEEVERMIKDCIKRDSKLTAWEFDFIQNIAEQNDVSRLSRKQIQVLEEIWERIT